MATALPAPLENPKRSGRERTILLPSELSPSVPTSLVALLITLGSILRSRLDLQLEIPMLALRHQNWRPRTLGSKAPPTHVHRYIFRLIESMGMSAATLIGHDIGGQIAYSYLSEHPCELQQAEIMNVAVPCVHGLSERSASPYPTDPDRNPQRFLSESLRENLAYPDGVRFRGAQVGTVC
jgi:pimeloyl-ACP methyl ester carboxylesterase